MFLGTKTNLWNIVTNALFDLHYIEAEIIARMAYNLLKGFNILTQETLYEAWEDPGLLGDCPKCEGELKFNPFIAGGYN